MNKLHTSFCGHRGAEWGCGQGVNVPLVGSNISDSSLGSSSTVNITNPMIYMVKWSIWNTLQLNHPLPCYPLSPYAPKSRHTAQKFLSHAPCQIHQLKWWAVKYSSSTTLKKSVGTPMHEHVITVDSSRVIECMKLHTAPGSAQHLDLSCTG